MEPILEIFAEIFCEAALAVAKGKFPLWAKIIAVFIISAIFIGLFGVIGFIGISCILEENYIGGAVILIMDMSIISFALKEIFNSRNNHTD